MDVKEVFSGVSEIYSRLVEIEKRLYQLKREFLDGLGENELRNVLLSISENDLELISRLSSLERQVYDVKEEIMDLSIFLKDNSENSKSKNKKRD